MTGSERVTPQPDEPRDEALIRADLAELTGPHNALDKAEVYDRLLLDVEPLLSALAVERDRRQQAEADANLWRNIPEHPDYKPMMSCCWDARYHTLHSAVAVRVETEAALAAAQRENEQLRVVVDSVAERERSITADIDHYDALIDKAEAAVAAAVARAEQAEAENERLRLLAYDSESNGWAERAERAEAEHDVLQAKLDALGEPTYTLLPCEHWYSGDGHYSHEGPCIPVRRAVYHSPLVPVQTTEDTP